MLTEFSRWALASSTTGPADATATKAMATTTQITLKSIFTCATEFRPDPKRKLNVAEFCESNDGVGASSLDFIGTHWSVQVCRVDQTYSGFRWYRTMVAECFLQLGGCDLARCCRSIDSEIFNDFFRFHFDSVFHGHFRPWYF